MGKQTWVERLCDRFGIAMARDTEKRSEHVTTLLKQHAKRTADLAETIDKLEASIHALQKASAFAEQAQLLAIARKQDLRSSSEMGRLMAALEQEEAAIAAHVVRVMTDASVNTDPFPHLVIEGLLPAGFYDRIIDALPPRDFWRPSGKSRDNWEVWSDVGPWPTEITWRFVEERVVDGILKPLLLRAFGEHLECFWRTAHAMDGATVRYRADEGRLQRRRKGYQLRPHLDPSHAALTGLLYLARPGDDPSYGTSLYRASAPLPAERDGIYYPEQHGIAVEHAATVPFRPNTMLVWMTSLGAHGADLTGESVPKKVERYTYQVQFVTSCDERAT
jgi:hypothetical protein